MPMFKLPLSGDVTQAINPWTAIFNPAGGQYGLVNITLGQSSAAALPRAAMRQLLVDESIRSNSPFTFKDV